MIAPKPATLGVVVSTGTGVLMTVGVGTDAVVFTDTGVPVVVGSEVTGTAVLCTVGAGDGVV